MHRLIALFVVMLLVATGCGLRMQVIKQSGKPSPLKGASCLVVAMDRSELRIGGQNIDRHLQQLPPNEAQDLVSIFASMDTSFMKGLKNKASGVRVRSLAEGPVTKGEILVTVYHLELERGWFRGLSTEDSWLRSRVAWTVDGQVTDEWIAKKDDSASMYTPTDVQRLSNCSESMGELAGKYFARATGG